jgi:LytS/YehU family sensor histidine kinase
LHPLFRSRTALFSYVAAWLVLAAIFGFMLSLASGLTAGESTTVTIPSLLVLIVLALSPWYTCRALPLRSTPPVKIVAAHILAAMCASTAVVLVARITVSLCSVWLPGLEQHFRAAVPVTAIMVLLIYLLSVALHYTLLAVESSKQAEVLSREAELKALKAQVNPHFLFNSLNSISALTTSDPSAAREMCIRLSDFLRSSLRLGERTSIPFSEELALTKTYLEVEQIRFGNRLRVRHDLDPACDDCEVPPLLVQPLIENAIKHGVATLIDGGEIAIRGRKVQNKVCVVIENPFDPDAPVARRNGFGLLSVRNRLRARFGNSGRLETEVNNNQYRVVLTLPCVARQ